MQSRRAPATVSSRRSLVADLVSTNRVHSQQELLELLQTQGFSVTQATLSRDLEALGATKPSDPDTSFQVNQIPPCVLRGPGRHLRERYMNFYSAPNTRK